jgi:hypothetical protein
MEAEDIPRLSAQEEAEFISLGREHVAAKIIDALMRDDEMRAMSLGRFVMLQGWEKDRWNGCKPLITAMSKLLHVLVKHGVVK